MARLTWSEAMAQAQRLVGAAIEDCGGEHLIVRWVGRTIVLDNVTGKWMRPQRPERRFNTLADAIAFNVRR